MRITLVERQDARLRCVPDLGIAHLLGQCGAEGIDATLVQGSPTTLECLVDGSVFKIYREGYKWLVKENGEAWLEDFLRFNYEIARSNEIADKTDPEALCDMWELLTFTRDKVWPYWLPGHLYGEIERSVPDAVGFSLWDFYENPAVGAALKEVMRRVRGEMKVPIIIGGPGTVTRTARRDILSLFGPDFVVHHEGELALPRLLKAIEAGGAEGAQSAARGGAVPNVSFAGFDTEAAPIEDLDSLAMPDFSQYGLDSFFLPVRVLPLMTARGCNWARCAFCSHHSTYKGYREHSVERVCETVRMYKKRYKTRMVMFHDETMTAERAAKLVGFGESAKSDAGGGAAKGGSLADIPGMSYYSYAYPSGYSAPLLKRMRESGFRVLVWGVESGCQATLDSMRKGTRTDEVGRILQDSHGAGITNVCFIMFGFPGETRERAEETLAFLQKNAPHIERHATASFRLEEGSPVWLMPELWGVKKLGGGKYEAASGMQAEEAREFLKETGKRGLKTCANTKYHFPGDSEMRAYFFMQVVFGEGGGKYPVRNGIVKGDEVWPSLTMKNVSRPKLKLGAENRAVYGLCDGKHKADASAFMKYPYVVFYNRPFN